MLENSRGSLILSIECPEPASGLAGTKISEGMQTLDRLLAHYELPATWGLAEPSAWTPTARAGATHEVAILGDASWASPQVSRALFLRELERRISPARAAGLEVSSLIVADTAPPDHCDLMYKLGLRWVRGGESATGLSWQAARNLRFGLWELPAAQRFPGPNWLANWRGARLARRSIALAAAQHRPLHIALDGGLLASGGLFVSQLLDSVLRTAARRRDLGVLRVQTMAAAAAGLGRSTAPGGATSILRPRAA